MTGKPPIRDAQRRRIIVVCEAAADQRTGCTLADRVVRDRVTWIEDDMLDAVREWSGLEPGSRFIAWTAVRREAERRRLRTHGHFAGEPGALDARAARRALTLVARACSGSGAVVLIRDSDNRPERRVGLSQARDYADWPFVVVVGVAHTKRECWLLAAFEPADESERQRLQQLRQELGFDPRIASGRLTAQEESARRSAKRVLGFLSGHDASRAEEGAVCTLLDALRQRGQDNGLNEYLEEVETRLVLLFQ